MVNSEPLSKTQIAEKTGIRKDDALKIVDQMIEEGCLAGVNPDSDPAASQ
jgi:hypothetical protein